MFYVLVVLWDSREEALNVVSVSHICTFLYTTVKILLGTITTKFHSSTSFDMNTSVFFLGYF